MTPCFVHGAPWQDVMLMEFMRLLCEGHYLPNQNILRSQPNNKTPVNTLEVVCEYVRRGRRFLSPFPFLFPAPHASGLPFCTAAGF